MKAAAVRVHTLAVNCPECNEPLGLLEPADDGSGLLDSELSDEVLLPEQVHACDACEASFRIPRSAFTRLGIYP